METSRGSVVGLRSLLAFALLGSALWCSPVLAQMGDKNPHAGYVYPAGGCRGTIVEVVVGGQNLNRVDAAYVSGSGITAKILQYARPLGFKQLQELRKYLMAAFREKKTGGTAKLADIITRLKAGAEEPDYDFPVDHPLLRHVDEMTADEMERWASQFLKPDRKQQNAQLAELAVVEVAIAPDAALGDRTLVLNTPGGLTNPLCFQVGGVPEIVEREPNDPKTHEGLVAEPPVVLNGQIMPGDVDRFRVKVRKGQQLVVRVQARSLMPFLADAVPGWFQPTLAVYDMRGEEVAFADDYRFDPDPVLCYKVHADGEYDVEIRDSIYRGREDFVYRVTVGEMPFVTSVYPLGGPGGEPIRAAIAGWNLHASHLSLDAKQEGAPIRQTFMRQDLWVSNPVAYAVGDLPELNESEPNDSPEKAKTVKTPCVVNGVIGRPGDVDCYAFEARAGERVVLDVCARRLNSPLDSLVRLCDASGKVVAWNDDREQINTGTLAQHADSYLSVQLPEAGVYHVQVSDAQRQGGDAYAYRLRIGPPRPDFTLYATPSVASAPPGRAAVLCAYVVRQDGFDGAVDLSLRDAPEGFRLDGARIPAGRDKVRFTITAPAEASSTPAMLHIEGRAQADDRTIAHEAVPSEDMMQAFIYRHLVPEEDLLFSVGAGRGRGARIALASSLPVRVPEQGTAEVRIRVPKLPKLKEVKLALVEPPDGISVTGTSLVEEGLALQVKATGAKPGTADNLIVEAYAEVEGGKGAQAKKRVSFGVLPAIPFEVVPK